MKKRILAVDDDKDLLEILGQVLSNAGYEVQTSRCGDLAKFLLGMEKFDIIISDIKMPIINGIQLLAYVKQKSQIPVLLISAYSDIVMDAEDGKAIGADGFIQKPFNKMDLLKTVEAILNKKKSGTAA